MHIIYIYIYIFNSWNIDCDPGFYGVFCKTTIIRQLRKWNESKIGNRKNTKKYRQKTVEKSYESLRTVVSVERYVGECVCVYVFL